MGLRWCEGMGKMAGGVRLDTKGPRSSMKWAENPRNAGVTLSTGLEQQTTLAHRTIWDGIGSPWNPISPAGDAVDVKLVRGQCK